MGSYPEGRNCYPLMAARPRRVWAATLRVRAATRRVRAATRRVGGATLSWRRIREGYGQLPTLRGCTCFGPCGDESREREILGSVLRLRGRVPGGRRQAEVRRPDGQVPSGLVSAGPSLRERLPEPAAVGGAATILILSFAGRPAFPAFPSSRSGKAGERSVLLTAQEAAGGLRSLQEYAHEVAGRRTRFFKGETEVRPRRRHR